jgi:RNA polymerase sigma factor (sigma-70 family)
MARRKIRQESDEITSLDEITLELVHLKDSRAASQQERAVESESTVIIVLDEVQAIPAHFKGRKEKIAEITSYLHKWLPKQKQFVLNSHEVDDLIQEAALSLLEKSEEDWNKIQNHNAYTVGIIHNLWKQKLSKQKRLSNMSDALFGIVPELDPQPSLGVSDSDFHELRAQLARAIVQRAEAVLRGKQLKAFLSYAVLRQGSQEEIAQLLGWKASNFRKSYSRAVNAILGVDCNDTQKSRHSLEEIDDICECIGCNLCDINFRELFATTMKKDHSDIPPFLPKNE